MLFLFSFFKNTGNSEFKYNPNDVYMPKYGIISGIVYEKTDLSYYSDSVKPHIKKKLDYIERKYKQQITRGSLKYRIPKELVIAIIYIENGKDLNPNAVGTHGEIGLMQILPATAGIKRECLFDPDVNIETGSNLLSKLYHESVENDIVRFDKVAIRYNAGYYAYKKCKYLTNIKYALDSINPITKDYVLRLVGKNGIFEILNNKS